MPPRSELSILSNQQNGRPPGICILDASDKLILIGQP